MFVNKTTLYRLKAKFEGTVIKRRDPGGQAQHLKNKMKKSFKRMREDDPFLIHAKTATTSNVSAQIVRRRLQDNVLKTRKPASKHPERKIRRP